MNGNPFCSEINIVGDGIVGIFDSPKKYQLDRVFSSAAKISSLIDVLNCKYDHADIEKITVGIGLSYGRALMIKSGAKGSGINDVVWMGEVVNEATKLSIYGNSTYSDKEMMVSKIVYQNLNEHNQNLLSYNSNRGCYHGYVINTEMNDWYKDNCVE